MRVKHEMILRLSLKIYFYIVKRDINVEWERFKMSILLRKAWTVNCVLNENIFGIFLPVNIILPG